MASTAAFPETVAVAMVDLEMAEQETADPETADLAMAVPATVDPATVDPVAVDLETETVDLSTEQAFFASATVLSDHPVSFDTESRWPTLDFEGREQRRARFTRVVGVIIGALSVVALVAVTRPGPTPDEAAPVVASSPIIAEMPEVSEVAESEPNQPTPTVLPELSVSVSDASSSVEPGSASAPSASAPLASAPAASVARPRRPAPQAPVAKPRVPAPRDKRPPPAAHFAD